MSENRRVQRVEKELRQIVGQFLIQDLKNPIPGVLSVADVKVNPDLRSGKAFLTFIGPAEARAETESILAEEWPDLQREIGKQLKMKYCPKLKFFINDQPEADDELEKMIAEMNSKRGV